MSSSRICKIKEYFNLLPSSLSIVEKLLIIDDLICNQFWREQALHCNPSVSDFFTFMEVLTLQYQIALPKLAIKLDQVKVNLNGSDITLLKALSLYHSLAYCHTLESLGEIVLEYVKYYLDWVRPELIKVIKSLALLPEITLDELNVVPF